MKAILFLLLALPGTGILAQSNEFEGEIHYAHLYQFRVKGIDTMAILNDFGSSSKYYYKAGSYKWTFEKCRMKEEYFSSTAGKTFDRYTDSDTLFLQPDSEGDTLLRFEIFKNADTISGYVCDRIRVLIGNKFNKDAFLMRLISFSPELAIDPEKFKKFGSYCNYEVYKITRSAFLRIEMIAPHWPFVLRMEATKVVPRSVNTEEITIPENSIKRD